jgi:hypothetical protein
MTTTIPEGMDDHIDKNNMDEGNMIVSDESIPDYLDNKQDDDTKTDKIIVEETDEEQQPLSVFERLKSTVMTQKKSLDKIFEKKRELKEYDLKKNDVRNKCKYQSLFTSAHELELIKKEINFIVESNTKVFILQLKSMISTLEKIKNIGFEGYIDSEITKLTNKNNDMKEKKKNIFYFNNTINIIYVNDGNKHGRIIGIVFSKIPEFVVNLDGEIGEINIPSNYLCVDNYNEKMDFDHVDEYDVEQAIESNNKKQMGGKILLKKKNHSGGRSSSGTRRSKNDNLSDTSNTSIVDNTAAVVTSTGSNTSNYCE